MKRKILSAVALLIAILCIPAAVAFAHSGGTDENGGHWDHSTGTYHYHHGYPAHQHPNGVCPYLDDAPEESSESSKPSTAQERINSALKKLEDAGYSSSSQNTTAQKTSTSYQRGYDIGYKDGNSAGHTAGYTEGRSDGIQEGMERASTEVDTQTRLRLYSAIVFSLIFLLIAVVCAVKFSRKKADYLQASEDLQVTNQSLMTTQKKLEDMQYLCNDAHNRAKQLLEDYSKILSQKEKIEQCWNAAEDEVDELKENIKQQQTRIEDLSEDCATLYAQYIELKEKLGEETVDETLSDYDYSALWLINKSRPAPKEAKRIKELEKETKQWIERALRAEAELETLRGLRTVRRLTGGSTPEK